MEINPLALLEVSIAPDPSPDSYDDCVVVEPEKPATTSGLEQDNHLLINHAVPVKYYSEPEPQISAGTGVHFLHLQEEDPLASGSPSSYPLSLIKRNKQYLSECSPTELEFRMGRYLDNADVLGDHLHCTICESHIGCDIRVHSESIEHPLLKVLTCEKCVRNYKHFLFPLNKNYKDTRCRWCGKIPGLPGSTPLRLCSQCPFGICEGCLKKHVNTSLPSNSMWLCFGCDVRAIWDARCKVWALQNLKTEISSRSYPSVPGHDLSSCAALCKKRKQPSKSNRAAASTTSWTDSEEVAVRGPLLNSKATVLNNHGVPPIRLISPSNSSQEASGSNVNHNPMALQLNGNVSSSAKMTTDWLKQKLLSYEKDVESIVSKFKTIRENIKSEETLKNIETKVNNISTLLVLHSSLVKDCSLNLNHEWKEKRTRLQLEHMALGPRENPRVQNHITLTKAKRKINEAVSGSVQVAHVSIPHLKLCSVKLKRLSPEVLNTINRLGSYRVPQD